VAKLVTALDAAPADWFVEIGPGRGALTRPLAARVARVLALEVDRDLAASLAAESLPGVTVVPANVLELDLGPAIAVWRPSAEAARGRIRIVGNLPYNISSPILFKLLGLAAAVPEITDATLMLQREVADRLTARPGSREYGVLTVLTALRADVTRLLALPPGAFRPAPRVSSAVVRLVFRPAPVSCADEGLLTAMVRSTFTQRRKTLANALGSFAEARGLDAVDVLARAGLDGRRRPETLQLVELTRLADVFVSAGRQAVV
jgi:16S rRNA (adenine1518-N6/adenine1519-N6)-dimethyltransferase